MSAQLTLDALPEWRTRDGVWPIEAHQRGWVRLPYNCGAGREGDIVPGWVCCRCGGVELNAPNLALDHSCCFTPWRTLHPEPRRCFWLDAGDRNQRRGYPPPEPGPMWAHWMPERPP